MRNKSYSQNSEDLIVLDYFKDFKGTVLEIGANEGKTLSNSLLLIENEWSAILVEPSSVFEQLKAFHLTNMYVQCVNVAIGKESGKMTLHESFAHVPNGTDLALVSSLDYNETERWRNNGVKFKETEVDVITFKELTDMFPNTKFDFISIDAEFYDWIILQQINLKEVGCKCLCIEFNGNLELANTFTDYCAKFGMREIHRNLENQIFAL